MQTETILICILMGLGIFLFLLALTAVLYEKDKRRVMAKEDTDRDDWLFYRFSDKAYDGLFGDRNPDELAAKFGINKESYYRSCAILRCTPDMKRMCMNFVYGLIILFICLPLSLAVSILFLPFGVLGFLLLLQAEPKAMQEKAEKQRMEMENELPRFLDLLEAELSIGMPIENAIHTLCVEMPETLISREFMNASNEMQIGYASWQDALTSLASRYDVETLTDFVLNIVTAYSKGVSVYETVRRKNKDIKETHLLKVREDAGKMTSTILLPTTIFQLVPMIIYILVPPLSTVMGGNWL